MKIVEKKPSELIFAEYNPRQLSKDQFKQIKDSITRFGIVDPIIVNSNEDRKNIIIGGHQRVKVALEMGIDTLPCHYVNLTRDKERELNIRLNKNTGEWDWDILAGAFDVDELIEWGFSEDELDFPDPPAVEGLTDEDAIPEVVDPITKPGDLWLLGNHRLLCGDATISTDVDRLMDGEKADMVFTDPPYALFGNSTGVANVVDDNMVRPFFKSIMKTYQRKTIQFGHIYMCCDWHSAFSIEACAREVNLKAKNMCIWDKGDGGVGAMYQQCYEIVWFFDNSPSSSKTMGKTKAGVRVVNGVPNIWRQSRVTKDRIHNAQKPVEVITIPIVNGSKVNETVLDLFLGSGSTLIACEKTNRKCYGMELDPHYCDVIVKRWEEFTGKKAELAS